jgi:hypothetical protein
MGWVCVGDYVMGFNLGYINKYGYDDNKYTEREVTTKLCNSLSRWFEIDTL